MDSSHPPKITALLAPGEDRPPGLEPLEAMATLQFVDTEAALSEALGDTDVLLVTDFRTEALRRCWGQAKALKWVHATSAGVDAMMFPELVASAVPLTNAQGIFDASIAEYVLGAILIYAKDFHNSFAFQQRHEWRHRETERVADRRVLVFGTGGIGRSIGRLTRAAGMTPIGVARRARAADPDFGAVYAAEELPALLPEADFVVIASPLTEATRGLFNAGMLERMSPSARLINIGRGPIVDTDALVDALRAGELAGAALDVYEQEPLPADHPLWDLPGVIMTAHMAGDFIGWREALSRQFIDNFERWRAGRPLMNLVDKGQGYVAR